MYTKYRSRRPAVIDKRSRTIYKLEIFPPDSWPPSNIDKMSSWIFDWGFSQVLRWSSLIEVIELFWEPSSTFPMFSYVFKPWIEDWHEILDIKSCHNKSVFPHFWSNKDKRSMDEFEQLFFCISLITFSHSSLDFNREYEHNTQHQDHPAHCSSNSSWSLPGGSGSREGEGVCVSFPLAVRQCGVRRLCLRSVQRPGALVLH